MSSNSIQNLFILHAPAMGGHHLANLVALGNRYKRKVDYTQYETQLLYGNKYGIAHAHFSRDLFNSDIYLQKTRSNVFNVHLHNFIDADPNDCYPNKKFAVIAMPDLDLSLLPVKRFFKYNRYAVKNINQLLYDDITAVYKPKFLEQSLGAPVHTLKAEIFFSRDIPAILHFVESLDTKIQNPTLFQKIHLQWLEALEKEFAD